MFNYKPGQLLVRLLLASLVACLLSYKLSEVSRAACLALACKIAQGAPYLIVGVQEVTPLHDPVALSSCHGREPVETPVGRSSHEKQMV